MSFAKNNQTFMRLALLVVAFIAVISIAATTVFVSMNGSLTTGPTKIADIKQDFGKSYGFRNVETVQEKTNSGLTSKTMSIDVEEQSSVPLAYSINYLTNALKKVQDTGILNLDIVGTKKTGEKALHMKYYAGSEDDYKGNEFALVNSIAAQLVDAGADSVDVVSTPTVNAGRSTEVKISTFGQDAALPVFRSLWADAMTIIESQAVLDSTNLYSLTLVNEKTEKSVGTPISIGALFYDKATFDASKVVDDKIWNTLVAYSTKPAFAFLGAEKISYFMSPKPTTSKMNFVLPGDQPDEAIVNNVVAAFRTAAYADDSVYFAYSYTTSIKYANAKSDAYTEYSSNIPY